MQTALDCQPTQKTYIVPRLNVMRVTSFAQLIGEHTAILSLVEHEQVKTQGVATCRRETLFRGRCGHTMEPCSKAKVIRLEMIP